MPDNPEKQERNDPLGTPEVPEFRIDAPAPPLKELPRQLPLLPLRSDVPFPQVIMPLIVGRDKGISLLDDVMKGSKIVGLATQTNLDAEDPGPKDLYPTICVAHVLKMLKFPDGSTRIVAQGLRRARWTSISKSEPYLIANIAAVDEINEVGVETEALMLSIRRLLEKFVEAGGQAAEELQVAAMNTP